MWQVFRKKTEGHGFPPNHNALSLVPLSAKVKRGLLPFQFGKSWQSQLHLNECKY